MESIKHNFSLNPISIGLLLLAILTIWIYRRQGRAKLPPGPWHIPFVGNAWELAADPDLRKSLRRLHEQYDDIYRLCMGSKLAVVISGYEAIKEVFVKRGGEFSDRPDSLISILIFENQGRRNCVGESLARMELDLLIPALVQRFEFLPPDDTSLDIKELDGVFGITHKPKPFEIRAIVRKKEAKEIKSC